MPKLEVKTGKVKFFCADKGWGFIVPDDGGKDVYFHVNYFSGVSESYAGELVLEFDAKLVDDYRAPKTGDPIVYNEFNNQPKGLMAIHWLYPETLAKAEKALAIRPGSPDNYAVRVMRFGPEEDQGDHRPIVFWEGTDEGFRMKLDEGFPEMFDATYYVEKFEINGEWGRNWHPSNWHQKYKRDAQPVT